MHGSFSVKHSFKNLTLSFFLFFFVGRQERSIIWKTCPSLETDRTVATQKVEEIVNSRKEEMLMAA